MNSPPPSVAADMDGLNTGRSARSVPSTIHAVIDGATDDTATVVRTSRRVQFNPYLNNNTSSLPRQHQTRPIISQSQGSQPSLSQGSTHLLSQLSQPPSQNKRSKRATAAEMLLLFPLMEPLPPPPPSPPLHYPPIRSPSPASTCEDDASDISYGCLVDIDNIPHEQKEIIKSCMKDIFEINTPRDWQIEATNQLIFGPDQSNDLVFINRHTADRKSLVLYCTAAMKRRVTLILTPMLALGSDQVDKASLLHHNIEAYHGSEY